MTDRAYIQKVLEFIDYPWRLGPEMAFVDVVSKHRRDMRFSDTYVTKNYLNRLYNLITDEEKKEFSERFIKELEKLLI